MEKNTLLIINVALNWGSTGKIVEGIGQLAIKDGWNVYVAHGARYFNESSLKNYQVETKLGEMFHYVESSLFDAQGRGSRYSTKKFLKVIDSIRPDIVHIHNIHGCFINYPILFDYLREKSIPVVWTLHDCWAMTGHCVHFERTHCEQWKKQCLSCPQKHDFPKSYLFDRCKSNYSLKKRLFTAIEKMKITTVSSWLKGVAELSYLKNFPINVVYNGVDIKLFSHIESNIREQLNIGNNKMLLAVASGFEERKGIYDFAALSKVLPSGYQIVLIGTNENDRNVLPNNVIAISRTNSVKELAEFYSAADVLLSLSYEETFGLTIVEAMACGTPAIVYGNTAQPELITAGTGKIVPTGDIESLVKAIEEVCSKPRETYVETCRKHAMQYEESLSYQKYLDIYESIINKRN
ncbi:MAG: glycosyltransferase [Bacteroidaceae bacterium]|nr:glycosyltransferase [Bacteroidaceae bacterium]